MSVKKEASLSHPLDKHNMSELQTTFDNKLEHDKPSFHYYNTPVSCEKKQTNVKENRWIRSTMPNNNDNISSNIDITLKCNYCDKMCKSTIALYTHIQNMHSSLFPYQCEICGHKQRDEKLALRHAKKHKKSVPHPCELCDKIFLTWNFLQKHMLKDHDNEIIHQCDQCDKVFDTQNFLQKHMKNVHDQIVLYQCYPCDISFKSLHQLRTHKQSIHGDCSKYPFECLMCKHSFTSDETLQLHIVRAHGSTTVRHKNDVDCEKLQNSQKKVFVCPTCNNRFQLETHFKAHKCSISSSDNKSECHTKKKLRKQQLVGMNAPLQLPDTAKDHVKAFENESKNHVQATPGRQIIEVKLFSKPFNTTQNSEAFDGESKNHMQDATLKRQITEIDTSLQLSDKMKDNADMCCNRKIKNRIRVQPRPGRPNKIVNTPLQLTNTANNNLVLYNQNVINQKQSIIIGQPKETIIPLQLSNTAKDNLDLSKRKINNRIRVQQRPGRPKKTTITSLQLSNSTKDNNLDLSNQHVRNQMQPKSEQPIMPISMLQQSNEITEDNLDLSNQHIINQMQPIIIGQHKETIIPLQLSNTAKDNLNLSKRKIKNHIRVQPRPGRPKKIANIPLQLSNTTNNNLVLCNQNVINQIQPIIIGQPKETIIPLQLSNTTKNNSGLPKRKIKNRIRIQPKPRRPKKTTITSLQFSNKTKDNNLDLSNQHVINQMQPKSEQPIMPISMLQQSNKTTEDNLDLSNQHVINQMQPILGQLSNTMRNKTKIKNDVQQKCGRPKKIFTSLKLFKKTKDDVDLTDNTLKTRKTIKRGRLTNKADTFLKLPCKRAKTDANFSDKKLKINVRQQRARLEMNAMDSSSKPSEEIHDSGTTDTFNQSSMPNGENNVNPTTLAVCCELCNKYFDSQTSFSKHYAYSHQTQVRKLECNLCANTFDTRFEFQQHLLIAHTNHESYVCDYCDQRFELKHSLQLHLSLHQNANHFTCFVCTKYFLTAKEYKFHVVSPHHIERITCDICCITFVQWSDMILHKRFVHKRINHTYSCEFCPESVFSCKADVRTHICDRHGIPSSEWFDV